jgi:hypothetical protein
MSQHREDLQALLYVVGIPEITEANAAETWARVALVQHVGGPVVDTMLTADDIRSNVGMTVPGAQALTPAEWRGSLWANLPSPMMAASRRDYAKGANVAHTDSIRSSSPAHPPIDLTTSEDRAVSALWGLG